MIMAILGGDDAGGGVIWAPQVIERRAEPRARPRRQRQALRFKKGQSLPDGVKPMPLLTDEELATFPEPTAPTWCRVTSPVTGTYGAGPATSPPR